MKKTLVLLLAATAVFSPLRSQEVSGSHYDSVLRRIMEDDQRVRRQLDSLARAGTDVTELLPLYEEMARTDAANQRKALPILEEYLAGTLPLSDESLTTLYYVIQHADLPVQAKYAPFIRSLFERDIITNVEFAWFTDRSGSGKPRHTACKVTFTQEPATRFSIPFPGRYGRPGAESACRSAT